MTKLDWFNGDADALDLYERLVFISHAWDDLIDQDVEMGEEAVNSLMMNLLVYLPANPCFKRFEQEIRTLLITSAASYLASNRMQRSGDEQQIEIAHYLRYAVSHIAVFLITVLNGFSKAPSIISQALPVMIPERVGDYLKENKAC